jgi:ubiquinone/menaquinone biosynthesis C-methylase UbiE
MPGTRTMLPAWELAVGRGRGRVTEWGGEREAYSYEPFSRHGFYEDVNRRLVRRTVELLLVRSGGRRVSVVDLGCGTGALTWVLAEELRECRVEGRITAIDPSAAALAVAGRRLAERRVDVSLVQGDAANLAGLAPVDAVFFGNAVHLVASKDEVVGRIARALVPGGLFGMNSAFFTGAYAPGSEAFHRLWTARALRRLRDQHPEVRLDRGRRASAMDWLSPEEYQALLHRHGFEVIDCVLDEVGMTLRSFQDIGHYWMFIEGALPGAPLAAGADALGHGAAEAFGELGLRSVPRRWLQLVARARPPSG